MALFSPCILDCLLEQDQVPVDVVSKKKKEKKKKKIPRGPRMSRTEL